MALKEMRLRFALMSKAFLLANKTLPHAYSPAISNKFLLSKLIYDQKIRNNVYDPFV